MTTALRVFIDPTLARADAGELDWTLTTLLVGMGFAARPAPQPDASCDLAYVISPSRSTAAITIAAATDAWPAAAPDRLLATFSHGGSRWPRFASTPAGPPFAVEHGRLLVRHDLVRNAFQLLSGQAEADWRLDRHGRYTLAPDDPHLDAMRAALVSASGSWLQAWIERLTGVAAEPRWPGGKRAAVGLTHDVDYPEPVRWIEPVRVVARRGLAGVGPGLAVARGRRHHWHFRSWMDLERAAGARSAFYFSPVRGSLLRRLLGTPDVLYDVTAARFRAVIAEIVDAGFEVGLHMSYRACEEPGRVAEERRRLESAAGLSITGGRHHYWRLLPGQPDATLREHEQAGLDYDCSLFHDRYTGWRRAAAWPFFPYAAAERRPLRTLQVPTGWMDDQSFGMRRFNPGPPDAVLARLLDTALAHQGCFTVDIHEYVYDPELFPGWAKAYRTLVEQAAERGDVWITAPGELARHWRDRAAKLIGASQPLAAGESAISAVA